MFVRDCLIGFPMNQENRAGYPVCPVRRITAIEFNSEHRLGQWRQFHSIRTSPVYVDDGRAALTRSRNEAAIDSVEVQRDVRSHPLQRPQLSVVWATPEIRRESSA